MPRNAVIAFAVLVLLALAAPARVDAQYFVRGWIENGPNPFRIDSVLFTHPSPESPESYNTLGFGGNPNVTDSQDFRATSWPVNIWLHLTTGGQYKLDTFRAVKGRWRTIRNEAIGDSCRVKFDTMPRGAVEESGMNPNPGLELSAAEPSPFRSFTTISFAVPAAGNVELTICDLVGRPVRTLHSGQTLAGRHYAVWDGVDDKGRTLKNGVYFSRLSTWDRTRTGMLVLAR